MKIKRSLYLGMFMLSFQLMAQDTIISLWPADNIPNRIPSSEQEVVEKGDIVRISKVQEPTLEVYLPSKANATGDAVLIFPGGGYHILAYDWEGTDIAKFLNSKGIAGIVVKYRLPTSDAIKEKHKVPLIDAQRAIRLVRANAAAWNITERNIGIMGFSAGGHLASTLGTHFQEEVYARQDMADELSARPDFMVLVYPVISFSEAATHSGSRKALIGEAPVAELVNHYSNELQVTENTPPTLLIHAADDTAVVPQNKILFFQALRKKKVPAALHIYPKGGHGFSLAPKDTYLRGWTDRLIEWLENLE
ncbi:alpha/beta hydrolase [Muriicola sp. Z0-33]|uniref:alpha/beta hydrolase n=1 Tax=Muriicola sp. Z0-33 TaxID=2816957 RepID=UPI002237A26D|nr:alpha/beta hydrolase [Muriicola sp. Z0-33]MCW5515637.1 alpha/beta hydrolase [Muriicola sp. Z0-33]